MCGLTLLATLDGDPLPESGENTIRRMVRIVQHRGPDEQEYVLGRQYALGFTRLSLVDPQQGGQPLYSADQSLILIANGEVYNHRELAAGLRGTRLMRTGSDCEVLVHLWDERRRRFLDDVNGMFAIILVDRAKRKLVLARDRFGIKPLYFHRNKRRIVVASEIKALFADPDTPREVDWEAALGSSVLAGAPVLSGRRPSTWFKGVQAVQPGTIMEVDLADGSTSVHQYWSFPGVSAEQVKAEPGVENSAAHFAAEYRRRLEAAVRDCATADAEVGLFLSGGIDSSAVAALSRDVAPVQTFTVLNAGTLANGDAEYAARLSRRLGLANHQVVFEPDRVPTVEEWKRLLWQVETPHCGPEQYFKHELHRFAKQVRPEIKAMMLGAASDEFNGGYSVELSGETNWDGFLTNLAEMRCRGALLDRPELTPWMEQLGYSLLCDDALGLLGTDTYEAYLEWEARKIEQYNLWHEDRTAAASGIEARVPFLDHRLVSFVATIPKRLRRELLWDKRILRAAMRDVLPDEICQRPKVPFFYGPGTSTVYRSLVRLVAQDGAALLEEALAQPVASQILSAAALRRLLKELECDPEMDRIELLLRLINLGQLEAMALDLPAARVDLPSTPVPSSFPVEDWDADAARVETILHERTDVPRGECVALGQNTLLLCDDASHTCYIVVAGQVEYVVDEDAPDGWMEFLLAIDGSSTVDELLDKFELEFGAVEKVLVQAIRAGVLNFPNTVISEEGYG
jgi:asparagine synthase (glutamine-hydrolysing)